MIVWLVAIRSKSGLNAMAFADEDSAIGYLRHRYVIPAYVADRDVLSWTGANTGDDVLVDYDEI